MQKVQIKIVANNIVKHAEVVSLNPHQDFIRVDTNTVFVSRLGKPGLSIDKEPNEDVMIILG